MNSYELPVPECEIDMCVCVWCFKPSGERYSHSREQEQC